MEVTNFLNMVQSQGKTVAKTKPVRCTYYLQCQIGMRESEKMDLIGLTAYRLFMEIMNYVYSNEQTICVDLKFRQHLQKKLGYKNIRNINELLKKLYHYDFLGEVEVNLYRINPLASFKGSYNREFKKAIESYYKNVTGERETVDQSMLTAYLKETEKEWNDLTKI